ncbi:hypothetical protein B296_00011660 [Ensete ventricosum]|uniref:Uncharacterized protein n=1 Tax=Ensete ventricosum TaxID=4639 RepID=A0A427AAK3_ENSVE|nr:hypothetical protein B296_00011660 [Ensete ventricosum]
MTVCGVNQLGSFDIEEEHNMSAVEGIEKFAEITRYRLCCPCVHTHCCGCSSAATGFSLPSVSAASVSSTSVSSLIPGSSSSSTTAVGLLPVGSERSTSGGSSPSSALAVMACKFWNHEDLEEGEGVEKKSYLKRSRVGNGAAVGGRTVGAGDI